MNTLGWSLAALSLALVQCVILLRGYGPFVEGDYFLLNDNSVRDFAAYLDTARGVYPLHGPSTSIGGNHGYLAYYLYGLSAKWWGFRSWYLLQVALLILSGFLSAQLLRQVTKERLGLLVWPLLLASGMPFLLFFPNHITGIMPASLATLCLVTSNRRGPLIALGIGLSLTVHIGVHRSGYLMLLYLFALRHRLPSVSFRSPWLWLPLALYHLLPAWTFWLGNPPSPSSAARIGKYISQLNPIETALSIPFVDLDVSTHAPLLVLQLGLVLSTLWILRPQIGSLRGSTALSPLQIIWWFYALSFALYLLVVPDQQYYMNMLGLLPALIVAGWRSLSHWPRRLLGYGLGALCLFGTLRHVHLPRALSSEPAQTHFYGMAAMAPILEKMASDGVPTGVRWKRTLAPEEEWTPSYWIAYQLLFQVNGDEREGCHHYSAESITEVHPPVCGVLEEMPFLHGWYWIPERGIVRQ